MKEFKTLSDLENLNYNFPASAYCCMEDAEMNFEDTSKDNLVEYHGEDVLDMNSATYLLVIAKSMMFSLDDCYDLEESERLNCQSQLKKFINEI